METFISVDFGRSKSNEPVTDQNAPISKVGIDSGPGAPVNPRYWRIFSGGFVPGTGHEVKRAIYVDCT